MDHITQAKEVLANCLPEEAERIIQSADMFVEAVLLKSAHVMDDATLNSFETLLETNPTPEKVALFCKQHVPSFADFVREELARVGA